MKTICVERDDGGVSIFLMFDSADPQEEVNKWQGTYLTAKATGHREIDSSEIPEDRTFRNAWGHNLKVDMGRAREIKKESLRKLRSPLLSALDFEFMRAVEADDKARQSDIAAKKQLLRDVTDDPEIAKASTPEELKAVMPEVLK